MNKILETGMMRAVTISDGIKTDTQIQYQVQEIAQGNMAGEVWLLITQGGMTGYESICLKGKYPAQLKLTQGNTPWIACAGCDYYSRLEVNGGDFRRVALKYQSK